MHAPGVGTSKSVLMTTIRWTTAASDRKLSCQLEQGRSAWLWFDSKGGHNEMLTLKVIIASGAKKPRVIKQPQHKQGEMIRSCPHPRSPDHNLYFVPLYILCIHMHIRMWLEENSCCVLWEERHFILSFLMISLQASELAGARAEMNTKKQVPITDIRSSRCSHVVSSPPLMH